MISHRACFLLNRHQTKLNQEHRSASGGGNLQKTFFSIGKHHCHRKAGDGGNRLTRGVENGGDRHDTEYSIGNVVEKRQNESILNLLLHQYQRNGSYQIGHAGGDQ